MNHGKNVRSPQLQQNTKYVMKTWGKTPTHEEVLFVHFLRANNQTFKQPTVQLKDMLATDFYVFKLDTGAELRGKMKDLCLVRADTDARITFAEVLQQSTALPVAPAPAPVQNTVVEVPAPSVEELAQIVKLEPEVVAEEETVAEVALAPESPVADYNEAVLLGSTDAEESDVAAPEGESKEDRKRRLDRVRKQAKRDAAKAALTALVTPASDTAQATA